jgi:hypothetical protein
MHSGEPWPARRLDAGGVVAELALLSKSPQREPGSGRDLWEGVRPWQTWNSR